MSQAPALPMTGDCQCGGVCYQLWDAPEAIHVCHRGNCHRSSGSTFAISLVVRADAFRLTAGEPHVWTRATDAGGQTAHWFCPDCGTRLWHVRGAAPAFRSIRGGTFDQPPDLTEAVHLFTKHKLHGVIIPEEALSFPGDPRE